MPAIMSALEFVQLSESDDPVSRERARHDAISDAAWNDIQLHASESVRVAAVRNKTVQADRLESCARDPSPNVRHAVAMRRATSESALRLLATDTDETVRSRVAWNPSTPRDILDSLARDPSEVVRTAVRDRLSHQTDGPSVH
jgi:hypothetical protein